MIYIGKLPLFEALSGVVGVIQRLIPYAVTKIAIKLISPMDELVMYLKN
jgi:hypothetical protein